MVMGCESHRKDPCQICCQKNAPSSSCPFWYISTQGSDIHVMLANSFHAMVAQTVDSTPRVHHGYDHPRCLSALQVPQVEEKWSPSQRQTEPSMQRLWPSVCRWLRARPRLG